MTNTPPPSGVCCPKCGGRRFDTVFTRHRGVATDRVKRCRACNHRIRTSEKLVRQVA